MYEMEMSGDWAAERLCGGIRGVHRIYRTIVEPEKDLIYWDKEERQVGSSDLFVCGLCLALFQDLPQGALIGCIEREGRLEEGISNACRDSCDY